MLGEKIFIQGGSKSVSSLTIFFLEPSFETRYSYYG